MTNSCLVTIFILLYVCGYLFSTGFTHEWFLGKISNGCDEPLGFIIFLLWLLYLVLWPILFGNILYDLLEKMGKTNE
jgi:hypothetical protein